MDKKTTLKIVKKYLNYIINEQGLDIKQAYIFGSYAKDLQNQDSDIDLAIVFNSLNDRLEMQLNLMKWRRNFDLSIEPHPFDEKEFNKNNPFAYEIINTGINLKINWK